MASKSTKLSKPMQDVMWGRGYYELNTARALEKRGLAKVRVVYAYGGRTVHLDLTDAGRAWIAEQIDAAHVEALKEYAETLLVGQAVRLLARYGLASVDEIMVGRDAREAWELYGAARAAKEARDSGAGLRAVHIAKGVGYSLDVLRKIAA